MVTMQNMTKIAALATTLVVAAAAGGCGVVEKAQDSLSGSEESESGGGGGSTKVSKDPVKVSGNLDQWSDKAISAMDLPARGKDTVRSYGSCSKYYDAVMSYAKALEAVYVKRYRAWARYQLAQGYTAPSHSGNAPTPDERAGDIGGAPKAEGDNSGAMESGAPTGGADDSGASGGAQDSATSGKKKSEWQTNNQEKGVDETDYVKSNGDYVFVAKGNLLRVIDLEGNVVHAAKIQGETARGLHLAKGKLVLITQASVPHPQRVGPIPYKPHGYYDYLGRYYRTVWHYHQETKARVYKINGSGQLAHKNTRSFLGTFRDGREIDGKLHMVMQKNLPWRILGAGLQLNHNSLIRIVHKNGNLEEYIRKTAQQNLNAWRKLMFEEGKLMASHAKMFKQGKCGRIARLTSTFSAEILGDKLLKAYKAWDQQLKTDAGWNINAIRSYPVPPTPDHVTQVASIDLGSGNEHHGFAFSPVRPQMVYASKDRLVVGNKKYHWNRWFKRLHVIPTTHRTVTYCTAGRTLCRQWNTPYKSGVVHVTVVPAKIIQQTVNRFDFLTFRLKNGQAQPEGVGTVPGTPVNNYAIDAQGDSLRFAVTEDQRQSVVGGDVVTVSSNDPYTRVGAPYRYRTRQNMSFIRVLKKDGQIWKGSSELPLDVGGQIKGVRFFKDAAFVSTSSSTDPLYAVSFRKGKPTLAGAMPDGMRSSYFHPMGDGKTLLALGRLTPNWTYPSTSYRGYGLTVSMIDIQDLTNPKMLASAHMRTGSSQAEYDFKSFRFVQRLGLLVLPMQSPFRLEMLAAKRDKGFSHFGVVTLQDELHRRYGSGGNMRTMLFGDLLVGVFGKQDVGVRLNYDKRAPQLTYSKDLILDYQTKVVANFPTYWYLEGAHEIDPKWRSATLSR